MATHSMSCLTCGQPLDPQTGRCATCQPTPPSSDSGAGEITRDSVRVDTIHGTLDGVVDRTGTFQETNQPTSWTPRIAAFSLASLYGIFLIVVGVTCLGIFGGGLFLLVAGAISSPTHVPVIIVGLLATIFGGLSTAYLTIYVRTLLKRQRPNQ